LICTNKTHTGHLEGGAAMTTLIGSALQLKFCVAIPLCHFRVLNPNLEQSQFDAVINSENSAFNFTCGNSHISSFGFGGTNAHSMSYGKNVVTSRGIAHRGPSYYRSRMREKLAAAPPPEIMMLSEDPEDWETNGMPVSEDKIGKVFQVEVQEDGKAIWREVVTPPPDFLGDRFYLSGTFNDWGMDDMAEDVAVPNLHSAEITIGATGEELFHVIANEDPGLAYYPRDTARCTRKVEPIVGPEEVDDKEECCWAIVANPGTRYRIEFHCTPHSISLTWLRLRPNALGA